MSRLIEADKLHYYKVVINAANWTHKEAVVVFAKEIDKAETIDAVPVVRCKDCIFHQSCKYEQHLGLGGFCSYGERKNDG